MKSIQFTILLLIPFLNGFGQLITLGVSQGYCDAGNQVILKANNPTSVAYYYKLSSSYTFLNNNIVLELNYAHIKSNFAANTFGADGSYRVNRSLFMPDVKIVFHDTSSTFYSKFGMPVYLPGMVEEDVVYSSNTSSPNGTVTAYSQGNVAIGYAIGFGYNFLLYKHFSAFLEGNMMYCKWSPSHSEITESANGNLSIAQSQKVYVDNPQPSTNPDLPTQVKKMNVEGGIYCIGFGMQYYFRTKKYQ